MKPVSMDTVLEWFTRRIEDGGELNIFKTEGPVIVTWAHQPDPPLPDGIAPDLEGALLDAFRRAEADEENRNHGDLFASQERPGGGIIASPTPFVERVIAFVEKCKS